MAEQERWLLDELEAASRDLAEVPEWARPKLTLGDEEWL